MSELQFHRRFSFLQRTARKGAKKPKVWKKQKLVARDGWPGDAWFGTRVPERKTPHG
jgi:hypothetical protein